MKIQKKLLFLLSITSISAACYGMEEEVPKVRMDYYEKFLSKENLTLEGKVRSKKLCAIENSLFTGQLNLFSRNANKDNNFISRLARKIEALKIDSFKAVQSNDGPVYHYNLVDGTEVFDEINEHIQSQIDTDRKKRLSFWQCHPLPCLTLAFLAGGCITLKIYHTFYGK